MRREASLSDLNEPIHDSCRKAYIGEAAAISSLYTAGQLPEIVALTPLGASGAQKYIKAVIRAYKEGGADSFWVALLADLVVGFLQLRRSCGRLKVNSIFINARQQGKGIGGRLLLYALSKLRLDKTHIVVLDVFSNNTTAISWYESLGFRSASIYCWLTFPLPVSKDEKAYYEIKGLPEATIVHQHFGFSSIQIVTEHFTYYVGRMGKEWFRLRSVRSLGDQGLLRALKAIDQSRSIVLVAEEDELSQLPLLGQVEIVRSVQMRTEYSILFSRLEAHYGS